MSAVLELILEQGNRKQKDYSYEENVDLNTSDGQTFF